MSEIQVMLWIGLILLALNSFSILAVIYLLLLNSKYLKKGKK